MRSIKLLIQCFSRIRNILLIFTTDKLCSIHGKRCLTSLFTALLLFRFVFHYLWCGDEGGVVVAANLSRRTLVVARWKMSWVRWKFFAPDQAEEDEGAKGREGEEGWGFSFPVSDGRQPSRSRAGWWSVKGGGEAWPQRTRLSLFEPRTCHQTSPFPTKFCCIVKTSEDSVAA